MNERLKEFSEQAVDYAHATYIAGSDPHLWNEAYRKKFAELLVKECITVARGADGLDATHEAWYLIKQHFGVEE